jgi:hypothetical protein
MKKGEQLFSKTLVFKTKRGQNLLPTSSLSAVGVRRFERQTTRPQTLKLIFFILIFICITIHLYLVYKGLFSSIFLLFFVISKKCVIFVS